MRYDAVIAGGGPMAGFIAEQISRSGFSVLILEEHSRVGMPVQCAGLGRVFTCPLCLAIKLLI